MMPRASYHDLLQIHIGADVQPAGSRGTCSPLWPGKPPGRLPVASSTGMWPTVWDASSEVIAPVLASRSTDRRNYPSRMIATSPGRSAKARSKATGCGSVPADAHSVAGDWDFGDARHQNRGWGCPVAEDGDLQRQGGAVSINDVAPGSGMTAPRSRNAAKALNTPHFRSPEPAQGDCGPRD